MNITHKIRFSNVAHAIDLTPKAFRNWLQRYDLEMISDHRSRKWTEFTLSDIAVLAVTRELVRYGLGVEEANEISAAYLHEIGGPIFEYSAPQDALVSLFNGRKLGIARRPRTGEVVAFRSELLEEISLDDVPSVLWIDVGVTIALAFERAFDPQAQKS